MASDVSNGKRVLLVEDNEDNRIVYSTILRHFGYRVTEALNGEEGIAKARAEKPDLILMDISLGGAIDGLEATRRLRADPRFDTTPIIALTAHAMPGDRERVLSAGCDEHWRKPITDLLAFRAMIARVAAEGRSRQ